MKYKKMILVLFAITFFISAYVIWKPLEFGFCRHTYISGGIEYCADKTIRDIGKPLHFYSLFLLPVIVLSVFFPKGIFASWFRFVCWFIPLSLLVIFLSPGRVGPSGFMDIRWWTEQMAIRFFGWGLVVGSIVIIVYKIIEMQKAEYLK